MHMKVQFMELHGVTINILLLAVPIKNLKNGTLKERKLLRCLEHMRTRNN